jgi:hypothetical protein
MQQILCRCWVFPVVWEVSLSTLPTYMDDRVHCSFILSVLQRSAECYQCECAGSEFSSMETNTIALLLQSFALECTKVQCCQWWTVCLPQLTGFPQ